VREGATKVRGKRRDGRPGPQDRSITWVVCCAVLCCRDQAARSKAQAAERSGLEAEELNRMHATEAQVRLAARLWQQEHGVKSLPLTNPSPHVPCSWRRCADSCMRPRRSGAV
jgi:hypothetical protein